MASKCKNHRQGKKMGGKHTTVIDAAQEIIDQADRMPEVTKIVAGYIKSGIKCGRRTVKIKDVVGGLLLVVRGSTTIQEIWIYSSNISKTRRRFEQEIV